MRIRSILSAALCWSLAATLTLAAPAQRPMPDASAVDTAPHRTRLILKDGSYQVVMSYKLKGKVVTYVSAERGGSEEIPADLVDFDATHRWERQHSAGTPGASSDITIDPELLKEEADRKALTPEVAPNLELPELESVVALDTFHGTPELVPMVQSDGDLNRSTGHNILKSTLNPMASTHQIVTLKGVTSAVQMHVDRPEIFLRVGSDSGIKPGGGAFTVDTHGAGRDGGPSAGTPTGGAPGSGYVIVRADVRTDARVIASFNISALGAIKRQQDVVETSTELLPGGHWMRITPKSSLDFGEYALIEILSARDINLGVWDFGVHPAAPDNKDAIKPVVRRPVTLERRR